VSSPNVCNESRTNSSSCVETGSCVRHLNTTVTTALHGSCVRHLNTTVTTAIHALDVIFIRHQGRKSIRRNVTTTSSPVAVRHLSNRTTVRSAWRRAAHGPTFTIPLPRSFVLWHIEYRCQVGLSPTSAQWCRSLRVLKLLTPHGRTDGHVAGLISHLGRDD